MPGNPCSIVECDRDSHKKGWCQRHYAMWYRRGDPLAVHMKKPPQPGGNADKKQWIQEYKLSHGCADCGYNSHPAALDFDHRPDTIKHSDIKSGFHMGWETLKEEVDKCEVVCANCHRIRTSDRVKEASRAG